MRFKLDENLPGSLVATLENAGHDAATVTEQGLQGKPDERVASVCRAEDRILLTLDSGFADIRVYPPTDHPGIVVFRVKS